MKRQKSMAGVGDAGPRSSTAATTTTTDCTRVKRQRLCTITRWHGLPAR